jgi:hypothetical protein
VLQSKSDCSADGVFLCSVPNSGFRKVSFSEPLHQFIQGSDSNISDFSRHSAVSDAVFSPRKHCAFVDCRPPSGRHTAFEKSCKRKQVVESPPPRDRHTTLEKPCKRKQGFCPPFERHTASLNDMQICHDMTKRNTDVMNSIVWPSISGPRKSTIFLSTPASDEYAIWFQSNLNDFHEFLKCDNSVTHTSNTAIVTDFDGRDIIEQRTDRTKFNPLAMYNHEAWEPFCGGGFLASAIRSANFNVVRAADNVRDMTLTYEQNHGSRMFGSIVEMLSFEDAKFLPNLIFCGFPCTPWAVSGKALGTSANHNWTLSISDFERVVNFMKTNNIESFLGENVPNLMYANGGKDLRFFTNILSDAGFVVKYGIVNPNAWGLPEDRPRIVFVCLRKDIAKAVHFDRYQIISSPMYTVHYFKCILDILDTKDANAEGVVHANPTDSSIDWIKNNDGSFRKDSVLAHDRSCPAKTIVLGHLSGVQRTGNRIISANGAMCVITASDRAEGRGKQQPFVFIPSRNELRTLSRTELLRLRNSNIKLHNDYGTAVRQFGLGVSPTPFEENARLLSALLHKFHVSQKMSSAVAAAIPRNICYKVTGRYSVITKQFDVDFSNWCIGYAIASQRHAMGLDPSFRYPPFKADSAVYAQPGMEGIVWDLRKDTPVPLRRLEGIRPKHTLFVTPILMDLLKEFSDKEIIDILNKLGFSSGAHPPLRTICWPNHAIFFKDQKAGRDEMQKEIDADRFQLFGCLPFFPCRISPQYISHAKINRPRVIADRAHPKDGTEVNAYVPSVQLAKLQYTKHSQMFLMSGTMCSIAVTLRENTNNNNICATFSVTDVISCFRTGAVDEAELWMSGVAWAKENALEILQNYPDLWESKKLKKVFCPPKLLDENSILFNKWDSKNPIVIAIDLYMDFGARNNPWNWNRVTRALVHMMSEMIKRTSVTELNIIISMWKDALQHLGSAEIEERFAAVQPVRTSGKGKSYAEQNNATVIDSKYDGLDFFWNGIPSLGPNGCTAENPIRVFSEAIQIPDVISHPQCLAMLAGMLDDFACLCIDIRIPCKKFCGPTPDPTASTSNMTTHISQNCEFPIAEKVRNEVVRGCLEKLGCNVISSPKGRQKFIDGMPAEIMVYLGILYDFSDPYRPTVSLTEEKRNKILVLLAAIADTTDMWIDFKMLESLAGKLIDASIVVERGRLWLCGIFASLKGCRDMGKVFLSRALREDVNFWRQLLTILNPKKCCLPPITSIWNPRPDASHKGIGGLYFDVGRNEVNYFYDVWSAHEISLIKSKRLHINDLELLGVAILLRLSGAYFQDKAITILCDNNTSVIQCQSMKAKQKRSVDLLKKIDIDIASNNISAFFDHIIGIDNTLADLASRDQIKKFFEQCKLQFNDRITFNRVCITPDCHFQF